MPDDATDRFLAHIARCRTAQLPGGRKPIRLGDAPFGWVDPRLFDALAPLATEDGNGLCLPPDTGLEQLGAHLAALGLYRSHGELFDVRDDEDRVIGQIDRGALPLLGCRAAGVHLNGLVRRDDKLFLWVAHRAADKRLDPGKLDHLAAGGLCAGLTAAEALVKEAGEEAGIQPELLRDATEVATIRYAMDRPEGLRRDTLYCYDLVLPEDFIPQPVDGEVAFFELMPLETVFRIVRDTRDVKFNVNLVLIDLFLREGMFAPDAACLLREALDTE